MTAGRNWECLPAGVSPSPQLLWVLPLGRKWEAGDPPRISRLPRRRDAWRRRRAARSDPGTREPREPKPPGLLGVLTCCGVTRWFVVQLRPEPQEPRPQQPWPEPEPERQPHSASPGEQASVPEWGSVPPGTHRPRGWGCPAGPHHPRPGIWTRCDSSSARRRWRQGQSSPRRPTPSLLGQPMRPRPRDSRTLSSFDHLNCFGFVRI